MVKFSIFYIIKHKGIIGCEGRGEQSAKGEKKVIRCELFPIRPLGIFAKLKDPFMRPFGIYRVPFVCDPWHGDAVFGWMSFDQPFEKRTNNITFENATYNMGVQPFGFTTIPYYKYAVTGCIIDTAGFSA